MSQTTKITLSKGGSEERTVELAEIDIPDLWNLAKNIYDCKESWAGHAAAGAVLICWHRAHDLKNHIAAQPD